MTLGFDVYGQPPETTIAQLEAARHRPGKLREDRWNGTKVWVVGADRGRHHHEPVLDRAGPAAVRPADRARKPSKKPDAPANVLDMTFENYQPLGKGWVAPEVVIKLNGKEVQREEYRDVQADVPLQPDLYDTQTYHKAEWIQAP